MNSFVAAAVVIAVIAVVIALGALVRWIQSDGGPGRYPMAHPEADWSSNLPTRPYSSLSPRELRQPFNR